MKIIFYFPLLALIILATGCSQNTTLPSNNQTNDQGDFYCENDSDCVPLVFECGSCTDNSMAINKKFTSKYQSLYFEKCDEYRSCDALPGGESKCENKKCILIK